MKRSKTILLLLFVGILFAVSVFMLLPSFIQEKDRPIRMKDELLGAPFIVEGDPTGESRTATGSDGSTSGRVVNLEVSRVYKGKLQTQTIEILQNDHYPLEDTLPQGISYILFLDAYGKSGADVYSYESNWCMYKSDGTNITPVYDLGSDIHSWLSKLEIDGSPCSLSDWLVSRVN